VAVRRAWARLTALHVLFTPLEGDAMNIRAAAGTAVAIVLLGITGGALACGGDPTPENLVATPKVKAALDAAYARAHSNARVSGPVPGRTYFGMVGGDWYAVATFRVSGRTTKPIILVRHGNRPDRWHVTRETRGGICGRFVPVSLIGVWHLEHVGRSDCFVEPALI
jgi:hypothetical protein